MKELVKFIESYHPGFGESVHPAPQEEIEQIEEYFAGQLPGAYLRFLATMGGSQGALKVEQAWFDLVGIRRTYLVMDWLRSERFLFIAGDDSLDAMDYYLDLHAPHTADDFMVVRMPLTDGFDPNLRILHHAGLEEFLYYEAFRTMRLPLLPNQRKFVPPKDPTQRGRCTAEAACQWAETVGFRRIPPATRCALFDRGDAAMLLYRRPHGDGFSFQLATTEDAELERLSTAVTQRIGVVAAR